MKFGNIELNGSKIYNLKVESLTADPDFSVDDISRIYFNSISNTYKFNNGTTYVDLSLPNNFTAFVASMGDWINTNFTFNPTPFNNLNTISGLTSDSSLLDVITQIDSAIGGLATPNLSDLEDITVPSEINIGNVLYFDGSNFSFLDLDTMLESYSTIGILKLKDVEKTVVNGGSLVYNSDSAQFDIKQTTKLIEDFYNDTNHSISHGLGFQYLGITIINRDTGSLITNADVEFLDKDSLNITLPEAAPIIVILTIPYGS